jgi:putative spermidine/putrescine transport system permease protein
VKKTGPIPHVLTLLVLVILFALPAGILVLVGLAPGWRFPDLWPAQFSFTGIQFLITHQDQIVSSLASSFLYSVATVFVTLGMCLTPAAAFARNRFAGKRLMEALVLTPALVPPMTFAMGLHVVFIRLSLADTVAGVVLPWWRDSRPWENNIALVPKTWGPVPWRFSGRWSCRCWCRP